jgi:hypothetical protein
VAIHDYEFRIFGAATSGVETTIASSNLRNAPSVNGPMVDVLKGRTQSRPWDVEINDNGDFFSSIIADSGGRMAIQGRLCDLRLNKDGAGFSVIGTGRIGDIVDHVSHYTVSVQDERWRERTARVFTKQNIAPGSGSSSQYSGSILMPAGLIDDYGRFRARNPVGAAALIRSSSGNLAFVQIDPPDWNKALRNLIAEDVKTDARVDNTSTAGNFTHLLANIDGTDFEVATFDSVPGTAVEDDVGIRPAQSIVSDLDQSDPFLRGFWVVDDSTTLVADTDVRVFLYTPTAEPNELMPLHIGGKDGIRPFQLAKDISDEIGLRYSSSAMQDMIDDPDFGVGWWRIKQREIAGPWLEDNIYGPYGAVPLINSSGEVSPTKIHLPQDVASTDLFEFDKTNTARQPTWHYSARDRVTAIRFEYTQEADVLRRPDDGDWSADLISETVHEVERTYDRLDAGLAPRKEVVYRLYGVHAGFHVVPGAFPPSGNPVWRLDRFVDTMARERFERFGDGPIRGDFVGLSTTENVVQGDLVRVSLATFPAPSTQGRGATRIVQVLSRIDTPAGPEFEWLDAGPSLSSLTPPTLALALATSDPKHSVIATISGSSSTDVGYQLQWALSTVSTGPTSTEWFDWAGQGDSTGTNTIRPLPSGRQIWARARNTFPLRIRSAWGAAADTTTEALEAPSALASSSVVGNQATLDWALGASDSPDYPLEVMVSTESTGLAGLVRLPAGSKKFKVTGLVLDSTFFFGIRHVDEFGGVSTEDTLTVEMTTTPATAPALLGIGIEVVFGGECT